MLFPSFITMPILNERFIRIVIIRLGLSVKFSPAIKLENSRERIVLRSQWIFFDVIFTCGLTILLTTYRQYENWE